MRPRVIVINLSLGMLFLLDLVIVFQIRTHGWPTRVVMTETDPGVTAVRVQQLPFTAVDVWLLAALVGLHGLLLYLAWQFRKRPR
jgi:hypothetical protein